jgi:hypothetical protein
MDRSFLDNFHYCIHLFRVLAALLKAVSACRVPAAATGNTMNRSYNFSELEILNGFIPDFKKSFVVNLAKSI